MHLFLEEWPLMMFTLLSQFAVGTFITITFISNFMRKKTEYKSIFKSIITGLLVVCMVMGLALLFSLFHLGDPMGAYRAINNFATSWLSREIVFAGLFFLLTIVAYYFYKKGSPNLILGIITAIVGLLVVYSMASLYSSSIRPAWDNLNTYITFFSTTFLFGATGSILIMSKALRTGKVAPSVQSMMKNISIVAVLAVTIQIIYLPVFISSLTSGGLEAQQSLQLLSSHYGPLLTIKWVLSIIGVGLLIFLFYKPGRNQLAFKYHLIALAFSVVFLGEFVGRYIYYAIAVSIGIG